MALAMARPWKHPRTGIYWFRKRVPDELRGVIGKLEEKRILKTRDPAEAKVRHLEMLSEIAAGWPGLKRIEISFDPNDHGNPGTRVRTVASRVLWALEPGASFAEPSTIRFNAERWAEVQLELAAHAEWAANLNDCRAAILVGLGSISRHLGEVASSPT
jgi:hypothetical protein